MVHLPITSPNFPANAFKLYDAIILVARFDLIDNSEFMPELFNLNKEESAFSPDFARLGYGYKNSLTNFGSVLFIWLALLVSIMFSLPFKWLSKTFPTCRKIYIRFTE